MTTKPVSVKLEQEIRTRIESLAVAKRRTPHWMMREAILQYVAREERQEAFRKDTIAAWEEYQEAGLHATAQEVENWLESWGGDDELPVPECHK